MVNWILKGCGKLKLSSHIAHVALAYVDTIMAKNQAENDKLEIICGMSIYIAGKHYLNLLSFQAKFYAKESRSPKFKDILGLFKRKVS